jgi:hypothetical protein
MLVLRSFSAEKASSWAKHLLLGQHLITTLQNDTLTGRAENKQQGEQKTPRSGGERDRAGNKEASLL